MALLDWASDNTLMRWDVTNDRVDINVSGTGALNPYTLYVNGTGYFAGETTVCGLKDASLIGKWDFLAGVKDSSIYGNDGTLIGAATAGDGLLTVPGAVTDGMSFPSSDMDKDNGTVAAWIRTDTLVGTNLFFSHNFTNSRVYLGVDGSAGFVYWMGSNGGYKDSGQNFVLNEWVHVTVTWDNGDAVVYWNGEQVDTDTYTGMTGISNTAYWGRWSGTNYEWSGDIADAQVYNRTLTTTEIRGLAANREFINDSYFKTATVTSTLSAGATDVTSLSVGTDSPSGGFSGTGDIYATSGIKAMEGLYSEAVAYGAGLEVADNSQATIYTNVITGTATLTAATQVVYDPEGDFITDGVEAGHFFKVITATAGGSPGAYVGATGEIIAVTDATNLIVSFGSAGGDTIIDATAMSFVVYTEPRLYISDHGDTHFCVGLHEDASFKVCTDISNNDHAVHFVTTAGIDGNTGFDIEYDAHTFKGTAAMHINYDVSAFASADTLGTGIDVVIQNTGATAGDVHVIDIALGDPTNSEVEVEAVVTHEGVDPIAQYLGDPAALDTAFSYTPSAYTDRTAAFNGATDVQIFTLDDDFIILGSTAKYDEINVLLNTPASHSIIPTFHYMVEGGTWTAFTPADDTAGFSQNGTVRFESGLLTGWAGKTINEITGSGDNVTDYYWIKITRTRKILPTPPTEDTIQVTTIGARLGWDKEGRLAIKTFSQSAEPDTDDIPASKFCFWIDTDDSKLYICYKPKWHN